MADDQSDIDERVNVPDESGAVGETTGHGESPEPLEETVQDNEEGETPDGGQGRPVLIVPQPLQPYGWRQKLAKHKKVVLLVIGVIMALATVAAVPFTRYKVAGLVIKRDFAIRVVDKESRTSVTSATVQLGDKTVKTNWIGAAKINYRSGTVKLTVSKKYYRSQSLTVTVPIGNQRQQFTVYLEATGRPVPVAILNTISGDPVSNATVKAAGTEAKTDNNGTATIVLPAGQAHIDGTVSAEGYNAANVRIDVTAATLEMQSNRFRITPAGSLYFLSNASGTIDVVKTNLDGSDRQTVLAGTGREDKYNTVLLASRDWKYAALLSKRDGGANAKVFVIDTATDKLNTVDEGDATFEFIGWNGDRLIYTANRNSVKDWEPGKQALKSYYAPSKKITTLDETSAEGSSIDYVRENLGPAYVLAQEVVYVKDWYSHGSSSIVGKQGTFNSIKADGTQKKVVKGYDYPDDGYYGLDSRLAADDTVYVLFYNPDSSAIDTYSDGKITSTSMTEDEYYSDRIVHIVSPSGRQEFWSEYRDGKNTFFVADAGGGNSRQLGQSQDMGVNGWFTDTYVLLTYKGNELRIMPAAGLKAGVESALKVGDFYKPNYGNYGYGY